MNVCSGTGRKYNEGSGARDQFDLMGGAGVFLTSMLYIGDDSDAAHERVLADGLPSCLQVIQSRSC